MPPTLCEPSVQTSLFPNTMGHFSSTKGCGDVKVTAGVGRLASGPALPNGL